MSKQNTMGVDLKCRIFTDSPLQVDSFKAYLAYKRCTKEGRPMCQEMVYSGYYLKALERMSQAFPDHKFVAIYYTDASTANVCVEEWKSGKIIKNETRVQYKLNQTCDQLEASLIYFSSRHAEENCKCQYCSVQELLTKEISDRVDEAISSYGKNNQLHEITQYLPLKERD